MASKIIDQYRDGVDFEQAVHLVRQEYNVNYEVILNHHAPQEVFVQYGPEVRWKFVSLTYT